MAGIADTNERSAAGELTIPRERDQIAALLEMRWRLFVRNMRRDEAKVSFVLYIVGRLLVFGFSFGIATACGLSAYFDVSHGIGSLSAVFLWIFLGWQGLSLLRGSLPHGVETELFRFPLRLRTFVPLWMSAGAFEGLTIVGTLACLGTFVGAVTGGAGFFFCAAALALFWTCNLFLSRAIFLWFSRALASRRTREVLLILMSVAGVVPRMIGTMHLHVIRWLHTLPLPPGFFRAIHLAPPYVAAAATLGAPTSMLYLLVWDTVFALILLVGLRRSFRGDDVHEFAASAPKQPATKRLQARHSASNSAPGSPILAVLGIEWARLRHGGATIYTAFAPLLYVVLFGIRLAHSSIGPWMVPAAAAYIGLGLRSFNVFGADGAGMQTFLLSPVPLRTILLGKNLFAALLYVGQVIAATVILAFAAGRVSVPALLFTVVWMTCYICLCFSIGNRRSITSPTYMPSDKLTIRDARRTRAQDGGWISLSAILGTGALGAVIVALCTWRHHAALAPIAMLPFAIGAAVWFVRSLDDERFSGNIAATEAMMERLARAG